MSFQKWHNLRHSVLTKMGFRAGQLLVVLVAVVVVLTIQQHIRQSDEVVAQAATIPGKGDPSRPPLGILGLYLNTGFSLQPEDTYTYKGHAKTLTTATAHSAFSSINIMASDYFQWAQSVDEGKTWTDVKGANQANIVVTPNKAGTVYYQQRFQYSTSLPTDWLTSDLLPSGLVKPTIYYSRVAAVTTLPSPIPATGLTVKADHSYLYNNQKTYVHAKPTPAKATGNLVWTSSDTTEKIAKVDKNTGEVTANNGVTGTITVTGTMTNVDGSQVTASTEIEVGGGLDAQTVDEGDTATFQVRGQFDRAPDKVTWYKVNTDFSLIPGMAKDPVVSEGTGTDALSYTTPLTKKTDNQTQYYAKVVIKSDDGKDQTMTTNRATLTVKPDLSPLKIVNTIENLTYPHGNTPKSLTNVVEGDVCRITGTFTRVDVKSNLAFMIKLPGQVTDTEIRIDGQILEYYPPLPSGLDGIMVTHGKIIDDYREHRLTVQFRSHETKNYSYSTGIQVVGYPNATPDKSQTFSGKNVSLNFTDGRIDATANDVDFGYIDRGHIDQVVSGKVVGDGELLDIADHRQSKGASRIALRQEAPLSNGVNKLPATLSYDGGNDAVPLPLSINDQAVLTAGVGVSLRSIGTQQGQNLTVKMGKGDFPPGKYTTKLTWTIISAP